jgi:hypothetical protein
MPETIRVQPWTDPVIDTLGHDPRSLYAETFWLPTLGPTSLLLLRHLAHRFDDHPEGLELPVAETSVMLGLGPREGNSSPLMRSFLRLVQFDLACQKGDGSLAVRRNVAPVSRRHVRRLPEPLQQQHAVYVQSRLSEPPGMHMRKKAYRIAYTLVELDEDPASVERTLFTAGFHPSVCRDATVWACTRRDRAEALNAPAIDDMTPTATVTRLAPVASGPSPEPSPSAA